jgi:hypothetical protein
MSNNVSASSAKDNKVNIGEMALAMQADSEFMSDEQYQELRRQHGYGPQVPSTLAPAKVEQPPLRPTRFGAYIGGLLTGTIMTAGIAIATLVLERWSWQ